MKLLLREVPGKMNLNEGSNVLLWKMKFYIDNLFPSSQFSISPFTKS